MENFRLISGSATTREGFVEQEFHAGRIAAGMGSLAATASAASVRRHQLLERGRSLHAGSPRTRISTAAFVKRSCKLTKRPAVMISTTGNGRPAARWRLLFCSINSPATPFAELRECMQAIPRRSMSPSAAIAAGHDRHFDVDLRLFLICRLPTPRCSRTRSAPSPHAGTSGRRVLTHSKRHHESCNASDASPTTAIRFSAGRMTPAEQQFLDQGG